MLNRYTLQNKNTMLLINTSSNVTTDEVRRVVVAAF